MAGVDLGRFSLGPYAAAVRQRQRQWDTEKVGPRLWGSDPTLWPAAPAAEVPTRTGWLGLPSTMEPEVGTLREFAGEIRTEGFRAVVVLGMGGSSLAPDVYRRMFGGRPGAPELHVLDSTHPDTIRALTARLDARRTLFVVSSKSGTTTEPNDFYRYFVDVVRRAGGDPRRQFVAVTDPGSPLDRLAQSDQLRRVFRAVATVGGRYAALTMFGLVPAAAIGVDLEALLASGRAMATACGAGAATPQNPGLALGSTVGEIAHAGRDKLTFYAGGELNPFPVWVEQLVAESTGKIGRGIVPIVDEPLGPVRSYGADRLFVELQGDGVADEGLARHTSALEAEGHPVLRISVDRPIDVGGEFFRWEVAVASASTVLGVDPFDQPDVELAKQLAHEAMSRPHGTPAPDVPTVAVEKGDQLASAVRSWSQLARPGDYIAVHAYLDDRAAIRVALERLRADLLGQLGRATTLGFGPRFLHSTGQLHKGGPNTGLFLQLVDRPHDDVGVPGTGYTFGQLIRAQSEGDYRALTQKGRRILRVDVGADPVSGIALVDGALRG